MNVNVNPEIFREYDIRGIYPAEINESVFYEMGKAVAFFLDKNQKKPEKGNPKIVVGRDVRLSSEKLALSFIEGVRDYGFDVVDIGRATSPMFSFASAKLESFGGGMITASHNPPEYNGLKIVKDRKQWVGDWVGGEEIQDIYKIFVGGDFNSGADNKSKGGYEKADVAKDYIDFVTKDFKIKRKIKAVIDASGGAAALLLPGFLEKMGIDYIPLFFEADGSFSKHNPNPTLEEAQKFAKEKIKETGADFGVIFDGDADRMVVIDEKSEYFRGDVAGAIIGGTFLKKGDLFVYDTVSTRSIKEFFEKKGIKPLRGKIGHYFIKKLMEEKNAVFGLETSSHYYYKKLFTAESSLYSFRLLLEAMDKNPDLKISDMGEPFLKYFDSGTINIPVSSEEKWKEILEEVKKTYKDGRQDFEDGILVEFESWWFNVRPSHTEPLIRLSVEAKDKETMEKKRNEILNLLKKFS